MKSTRFLCYQGLDYSQTGNHMLPRWESNIPSLGIEIKASGFGGTRCMVALSLFRKYGHDEDNERVFFYNVNLEVDFYVPEDELAIQV